MKTTKKSFLMSILALLLCFTMLVGTTFAWFTDSVTSSGNKIRAGTLKLDLEMLNKETGAYESIKTSKDHIFNYDLWEPGYTDVKFLKVENEGSLSLKWKAMFVSDEEVSKLAEVIDVWVKPSVVELAYSTERESISVENGWRNVGTLDQFINTLSETTYGNLLPYSCAYLGIALHMQEGAGNEYQKIGLEAFDIQIVATQMSNEEDSFGKDYDNDAEWPDGTQDNICIHSSIEIVAGFEATCTEAGLTDGEKCNLCGATVTAQTIIPKKGHTEIVDSTIEATCTSTGLTEGKHCDVCGDILVAQQPTPTIPHEYDDKYDESCNECGFIRDAECAHRETEIVKGYDATCDATGLSDGEKCAKCGEILISQNEIQATGHTIVIDDAVSSSCTTTGLTEGQHCSECGEILVIQEVIDIIDHNESDWIVDVQPTEVEYGKQHKECTMCHEIMAEDDIYPLGTQGLEFVLSEDGSSYYLDDVGNVKDAKIVIPNTYNNLPVTKISGYAFYNCSSLNSLVIPNTVVSIEGQAFTNCYYLTDITLSNNLQTIGDYAFENCSRLTSINIPQTVVSIGDRAFLGCTRLETINMTDSLKSIGKSAFKDCLALVFNEYDNALYLPSDNNPYFALITLKDKSLTTCEINSETKIIAGSAFESSSLTSISIPEGVVTIGDSAFYASSSLTTVTIPDTVISIGAGAFMSCGSLNRLVIPNSVTVIGNTAFKWCHSIKSVGLTGSGASVELPNSITNISHSMFAECSSLSSVVLPDSVTSIGYYAFERCTALQSIRIPSSVKNVGTGSFAECTSLTSFYYMSTKEQWSQVSLGDNWNGNILTSWVRCTDGLVDMPNK